MPPLQQGEQEQLVYQFLWEEFDRIFQEETRLSVDKRALRWSHIHELSPQQISELFPCESNDVLLVVNYNETNQLAALGDSFLRDAKINWCDILILVGEDVSIFPHAGPMIEKQVPWHLEEVCKLSRPLSTIGGPPLYGFIALSPQKSRQNHLQPIFHRRT